MAHYFQFEPLAPYSAELNLFFKNLDGTSDSSFKEYRFIIYVHKVIRWYFRRHFYAFFYESLQKLSK